MKIFLEERIIKLSKKAPQAVSEGDTVIEYASEEQVRKAYEEFQKENVHSRIIFWSSGNFDSLKEDFLSLFKYIKAAGGLVRNERDELLVIFRYGKWDLPKGKLSTHKAARASHGLKMKGVPELPGDAAIREVKEETGLVQATIVNEYPSTYHIYYQDDIRYLKRTYWFGMTSSVDQKLIPQTEEDISIVKWATSAELSHLLENTYPSLKKLFLSFFKS